MSSASARGVRAEHKAAASLGSVRVNRQRGESAPDVRPITLATGEQLQAEIKSRAALPRLVVGALEQARSYAPFAIPLAVLYSRACPDGVACVPLPELARLLHLDTSRLPGAARPLPRARREAQLDLFGGAAT
jgi:hypothetical protein